MKGFGETLRSIAAWTVLASAAIGLVLVLQWRTPERSVEPVANKFLCDGYVAVGDTPGPGQLRQVTCVNGRTSDDITAAYEQNRQDAIAADVFGSPVYVLDGEVFWGQDRIELLADALKSGRAPYRSQA